MIQGICKECGRNGWLNASYKCHECKRNHSTTKKKSNKFTNILDYLMDEFSFWLFFH